MSGSFYATTLDRILKWSRSNSLWYFPVQTGCCADEVLSALGSRYDVERFGCLPQTDPKHADLLIVSGAITYKSAAHVRAIYDAMPAPKYVMAIGACADCGGPFSPELSYSVIPGVNKIIPVDVFVPGCPPRPEAIMNGLIALQEKIHGIQRTRKKN